MSSREQGMTLVDVIIGASIVVIVVALAFPGFKLAQDTISTGGRKDRLERVGDRLLGELLGMLRSGRITAMPTASTPPVITMSRVRAGLNLDELAGSNPQIFDTASRLISFEERWELSEAAVGEDLNADKDRKDTFAVGVLTIDDGESARPIHPRPLVMLALPSYAGDLNGDGVGDPLFRLDGRTLYVDLQLVDREENGRFLRTERQGSVKLRNTQH